MTADTNYLSEDQFQYYSENSNKVFNSPSIRRIMKRRIDSKQIDDEFAAEPSKKRFVYEERMSNKLSNFHINDNSTESKKPLNSNNSTSVEEITDWGIEDIEVDNSLDPIIEDDLDDLEASSSKILLSDQLKCYIKDSKNVNKFSFIKGPKTGKELVLYRPYLSNKSTDSLTDSADIRDRIIEVENWVCDDNDFDGICNSHTISFPEDTSSSFSCIGSVSSSSSSISLNGCDTASKETVDDIEFYVMRKDDEDEMDID